MKTTNDLKQAGITESHAGAIAPTLCKIVDNQATTNEVLGETNEVLGETNEVLGETNEVLGKMNGVLGETNKVLGETNKVPAVRGKALAEMSEECTEFGKEVTSQCRQVGWAIGFLGVLLLLHAVQSSKSDEVSRLTERVDYIIARLDSIAAASGGSVVAASTAVATPDLAPVPPAPEKQVDATASASSKPPSDKQPAVAAPGSPEVSAAAP